MTRDKEDVGMNKLFVGDCRVVLKDLIVRKEVKTCYELFTDGD